MSCGSDGKSGSSGENGKSCHLEPIAGNANEVSIICNGTEVDRLSTGPTGNQGDKGTAGEGCYLQSAGGGVYDVICNGETAGQIIDGENNVGGDGSKCTLEDKSDKTAGSELDSLIITCQNGDKFVMSLCNSRTFNANKYFCGEWTTPAAKKDVIPLCNGSSYGLDSLYCTRNLIIEAEYKLVGDSLHKTYKDIDKANPASDNWMVASRVGSDTTSCFAFGAGYAGHTTRATADIMPCSHFGVLADTLSNGHGLSGVADTTAKRSYDEKFGDTIATKVPPVACPNDRLFDLATGKCVVVGGGLYSTSNTTAPCVAVMDNANTCYTANAPSANTNVFARSCTLDTLWATADGGGANKTTLFYDVATVKECNDRRVSRDYAFTCASGKYYSEDYSGATSTFNGASYAKRIACVSAFDPITCPEGSTYIPQATATDAKATCAYKSTVDEWKNPVCPTGYRRGNTNDGEYDSEQNNPVHYCFAPVSSATCPAGTVIVEEGDEIGTCIIAPALKTVPALTGSRYTTRDNENGRFIFAVSANTTGVCPSSWKFDEESSSCVLASIVPKCLEGYTLVKTKIGADEEESYYCTYEPKATDCPPYTLFNNEAKMCYNRGMENSLYAPNCPYAVQTPNTGVVFSAANKVCYEKLSDTHCPINTTLSTDPENLNECEANPQPPTCPEGGEFNAEAKNCYRAYSNEMCQTNNVDFSYNDGDKECSYSGSPIACPASGWANVTPTFSSDFKLCTIPINTDASGSTSFCKMNTANDWGVQFAAYGKITVTDIEGVDVILPECNFVAAATYPSPSSRLIIQPVCDETGKLPNVSGHSKCEKEN
jgi:hypothetical protein